MAKRKVSPRSLAQDTRVVSRTQRSFNRGMIRDREAVDIPMNSVSSLVNARGYSGAIKGTVGTRLWQDIYLPNLFHGISLTLTIVNNSVFAPEDIATPDAVGHIIYGERQGTGIVEPFFIIGYKNSTELTLDKNYGSTEIVIENCRVNGKVNARYFDDETRYEYMHTGMRVYARNVDQAGTAEGEWVQFKNITQSALFPNTESQFFKVQGKIILSTSGGFSSGGGIFLFSDIFDTEKYAIKMNGDMPRLPLDNGDNGYFTNPSVYRYIYTYSRIKGNWDRDRNSEGTFLELETAPYLLEDRLLPDAPESFIPFDENADYTQVRLGNPIVNSVLYRYAVGDEWNRVEKWNEITDLKKNGTLIINYEDGKKTLSFDFSKAVDMVGVADSLQRGFRVADSGFNVTYNTSQDETSAWFSVWNDKRDVDWSPSVDSEVIYANVALQRSIRQVGVSTYALTSKIDYTPMFFVETKTEGNIGATILDDFGGEYRIDSIEGVGAEPFVTYLHSLTETFSSPFLVFTDNNDQTISGIIGRQGGAQGVVWLLSSGYKPEKISASITRLTYKDIVLDGTIVSGGSGYEGYTIFNIDSATKGGVAFVSLIAIPTSYKLATITAYGALTASSVKRNMGAPVSTFRYPTDRFDLTHYNLYRTRDIAPIVDGGRNLLDPRLTGTSPDVFAWVQDIPVCGVFSATVVPVGLPSGRVGFRVLTGEADYGLIGSIVEVERPNATKENYTILDIEKDDNYDYYVALSGAVVVGEAVKISFGGAETFTASKVAPNTTTIVSSRVFTSADVGKVLFWEFGKTSIIDRVEGGTAYTMDSAPVTERSCCINPTQRTYYDTTNNPTLLGNLAVWGLKTRYYDKMPSSNIAAYHNGILCTAIRDSSDIHYCGTSNLFNIGYKHSQYQVNDLLEKGIRCMFVVNDLICILTPSSTHTINPKGGQVVTNTEFGEQYVLLPDPYLAHSGIGTDHQFKHKMGERGDMMVLTSEPALRFFNGRTYDRNLADGLVLKSDLQKLSSVSFVSYNSNAGIHIWGEKNG